MPTRPDLGMWQSGDGNPNYSENPENPSADKRVQKPNPLRPEMGVNPADSLSEPKTPLWRDGQMPPNDFLAAPFPVVRTEGDTSGAGTEVKEIDIYSYGDCYDVTAPTRVREVGKSWIFDPDFDGDL